MKKISIQEGFFFFALLIFSTCPFISTGVSTKFSYKLVGTDRWDKDGINNFEKWLKSKGFRLHSNAVIKRYYSSHGQNIFVQVVNGSISPGDEIVACPYRLLLPPWLPKQNAKRWDGVFSSREMLYVRLLHEARLGERSEWAAYLRILPSAKELKYLPIFWSDKEINAEKLTGTFFRSELVSKLNRVEELYQKIIDSKILSPQFPTMTEVKWAVGIVDSRSFMVKKEVKNKLRLDGVPFLAPLADILNHGHSSEVGYQLGKIRKKKRKKKRKKSFFRMLSMQTFQNSQELTQNYLTHSKAFNSNSKTYIHYGFCSDRILPTDSIALDFKIPEDADINNKRREEVRQQTKTPSSFFIYNEKARPENMIDWFLIMQMEEEAELENGAVSLAQARVSVDHTEAALNAMKSMFEGFQKAKQTMSMKSSCTDKILHFEQTILDYHVSALNEDLERLAKGEMFQRGTKVGVPKVKRIQRTHDDL